MEKYNFRFKSIGGTSRVDISTGEDIKHLGELDQKLWTVLSCPTTGLEFDQKTLEIIDSDKDGKIRVGEVVAAADYLTSAVTNADDVLKGEDSITLSAFNQENPAGKKLHDSAKQIIANLGLDKDSISLAESGDSVAIFANSKLNGDGVITPATADDDSLKAVIEAAVAATGGSKDRSGVQGVNADQIEAFYKACSDYSAWNAAKAAEGVLPYGDNTEAALAAVEAVKDKVADYFMRCKLSAFDEDTTSALDVQVAKVSEISGSNLAACGSEIASYPLARVNGSKELPLDSINPAWQAPMASVKTLVLDVDYPEAKSITEEQWNAVVAKFAAYSAWKAAKAGAEVEALGLDKVNEILKADAKADLLALVEQDKALESEANSIDEVDKFLHLYKNFYTLLRNYVTMDDFYDTDAKAIFQAGKLYLDQRCLDLCIKVDDMGKHGDMSGLSGMFIIYCNCVSKSTGKAMTIAAVLTEGKVDNLRVGTNAIFYDRNGVDYDATVIKIVDNPVSVKQAILSPYRKFGRTISERLNKSIADKEAKSMSSVTEKANAIEVPTTQEEGAAAKDAAASAKAPFDIAKFAGIFAAIGMALGMIGSAIMAIISPFYNLFILIGVVLVVISGPSVIMTWIKLRRRNLAPLLNANGWAINAQILVSVAFGSYFTSLAKFPALESVDPKLASKKRWRRFRNIVILLAVLAGVGYYGYTVRQKKAAAAAERAAFVADSIAKADSIAAVEASAAAAVQLTEVQADSVAVEAPAAQ